MSGQRAFDLIVGSALLLAASPAILLGMVLIWLQDGGAPVYLAPRVARGGRDFRMIKLRTMDVGADRAGGSSTARDDPRITPLGQVLRRWKLDELPQLINVVLGEMSLVGPRPGLRGDLGAHELRMLSVRPGLTDLASIVFADEAEILAGRADADAAYDRLIRPWKTRLALLCIEHRSVALDVRILWLTALTLMARRRALAGVARILARWDADTRLREICLRDEPLPDGLAA